MKYQYSLLLRILTPFIISYSLLKLIFFHLTLNLSYLLLKLINPKTWLIDNFIIFKETTLKFIPACAAISAYYLLLILIVFTKDIKFLTRIKILLFGSLMLLITNLFRILLLTLILDKYGINYFEHLHLFFWSIISSIIVALIWILFVKRYKIRSIPIYSDIKYLLKKTKIFKE